MLLWFFFIRLVKKKKLNKYKTLLSKITIMYLFCIKNSLFYLLMKWLTEL